VTKTYLKVSFQEKERPKALGALWDPIQKKWYVPAGLELAAFQQWLDPGVGIPVSTDLATLAGNSSIALSASPAKGISLSELLGGISKTISRTYRQAIWIILEVVQVKVHSGHVYLEVSERDATGRLIA